MSTANASTFTEKLELPSRGILGGPQGVTIRSMVTADEKLLLGSDDVIDTVLKSCIIEPEDVDLGELTNTDKHFLLIKLRIISYGEEYYVEVGCTECGRRQEVRVNLEQLPIAMLADDFKEPYDEIILPVTGLKIGLKVPRAHDFEQLEDRVRRFQRKFPDAKGDISYIYRLMMHIMTVNDDDRIERAQLQKIVESLPVKDSSYFKKAISKLKFGYDTEVFHTCVRCKEEFSFDLPIGTNFFRTRYED
jgi:hypothetical protein